MAIRVFVTGGTFDKEYDELHGTLDFRETHVPEMLRLGRSRLDVEVTTLMMKDSLHITPEERALIVESCMTCTGRSIVVTHGTDTVVETARALAQQQSARTIVLTGAM